MKQGLRIKPRMRRLTRRYPRITFVIRSFTIFSAAFGGAYGFIAGSLSKHSGYDPNAFAVGTSFLFAIACAALAAQSMRMRFIRRKLRKVLLHNEALTDRNWELKEAEERTKVLAAQGDLIVLRDGDGRIGFVNEVYCELAGPAARGLIGIQLALAGPRTRRNSRPERRHARSTIRRSQVPLARDGSPGAKGMVRSDAQSCTETTICRPRCHRPYRS